MSDKNFKVKNGIDANGASSIVSSSVSDTTLSINSISGQYGLIQAWNVVGSTVVQVDGNGHFYTLNGRGVFVNSGWIGSTRFAVTPWQSSAIGMIVRGQPSQTGDLTQWQNSDGTVLAKIDSSGSITAADLTLSGNLTVNGTTTNLNSTNLVIEDKNIIIADVATPTDTTADGAGITIKGATDKTLNWIQSTAAFTSSEDLIISKTLNPRLKIIDQTDGYTAGIDFITNRPGYSNVTSKIFFDFYGTSSIQTITGNGGHGMHYVSGRSSFGNHWFRKSTTDGVQMVILDFGNVGINSISPTGTLQVNNLNSSTVGLIVKAVSTQTANLQEWQDSTGTVLTKIDNNAGFYAQYIEAKNTAGILSSGESQIKIASPDGLKDIRFWNRNDAGGLYYYNSSGGSKNILRIAHSTDPRVVTQTWQDFTSGNSANYGGRVNIDTSTTTAIGMVIRGVDSQTANLQEWQSSDGTVLSTIGPNGTVTLKSIGSANIATFTNGTNGYGAGYINYAGTFNINSANMGFPYTSSGAVLAVNATYAGSLPLSVRGYASQTADLQQWQNNAGTTLSKVDASGNITAPSYNLSDSKYLLRKTIKKTVDPAGNAVANNTYDLFDMNFPLSLQGTFYIQASIRGPGYGQNLTYSLPATYVMDWINQYPITNPFTNSTTWVDLTPLTFSPRHLMTNDYFKFQAKVNANQISFRIKLTGTLTGSPLFDIYIQHSEEFANSTITELNTTGTDATTSNVMPNSLSSKAGLSAIFNPITLYSNSASNTPLTIKGFASQTADILQIQDSSGTARAIFERGGALSVQPSTALNGYTGFFKSPSAAAAGLMVRGAASQTANLQEWQNSSGTALTSVDKDGYLQTPRLVITNGGNIIDSAGTTPYFGFGSNQIAIYARNAAYKPLVIQGAASQTANLQEWQNSSGTVENAIIPGKGLLFNLGNDGNGSQNLTQIAFGYSPISSSTGNWKHWVITKHNNAATVNNAIEFYTNDGTQSGVYPTNAIFGLSVTNGGIITPKENINIASASTVGLTVKGASSQTSDLQQWQNSSGTVLAKVDANGNFSAISKSFDIPHPTKENMRLRYASIEGPENGVYIRGTAESNIIELPEYWTGLVHEDSITVSLTAVGSAQNIYVEKIEDNKVYIGGELTKAFFTVYGERKDIDKLTVEY